MMINGDTRWIGVVADPVSHVRAPDVLNTRFKELGVNAVCIPLHVKSESLASFLKGLQHCLNLAGLVVTIPHKEAVIAHCGQLLPAANIVSAANIMRWDPAEQHWVGNNVDGAGFVAGVKSQGHSLHNKRVLLIGAGGAGKAIAYAVGLEKPALLAISNRTAERAEALVSQLQPSLEGVQIQTVAPDASGFDVIINATSLGLHDSDPSPVPVESLQPHMLVCEAVMKDTALLQGAREAGARTHAGQHMLDGQIAAMTSFFGCNPNAE